MLKITTEIEGRTTTFKLEGRLAGPWVNELERCWREIPTGYSVKVSLEAVTFIDYEGKKLLASLHDSGAELKAAGCMTNCIVQEITSENRRKSF
jgi:hypothetical protein